MWIITSHHIWQVTRFVNCKFLPQASTIILELMQSFGDFTAVIWSDKVDIVSDSNFCQFVCELQVQLTLLLYLKLFNCHV